MEPQDVPCKSSFKQKVMSVFRKTSKSDVGMETQLLSAEAVIIIGPKTYHYE